MEKGHATEKGRHGKEDKIIFVKRCKIWSARYKIIKKELGQNRKEYKNKRITQIATEI